MVRRLLAGLPFLKKYRYITSSVCNYERQLCLSEPFSGKAHHGLLGVDGIVDTIALLQQKLMTDLLQSHVYRP